MSVGIDIGTTSVKAVAADENGTVLARTRVPHRLAASHAGELAHDASAAWYEGPRRALDDIVTTLGAPESIAAVNVSAMVPSLCAVGADGVPCSDGLLYGDARGAGGNPADNPSESGELVRFLASLVAEHPDAAGYWPAQAVANSALGGGGAIDSVTAMTTLPLFDFAGWDPSVAGDAGLDDVERLPRIVNGTDPLGAVASLPGAILGPGTIDAFGEQLVAGADDLGDVLVILGATLIVWAAVDDWLEVPGLWTVPHTAPGLTLVGGPSNAGGLFVDFVRRLTAQPAGTTSAERAIVDGIDPAQVPVWLPHLRGERVPLHDPSLRATVDGLEIGMGPDAVRRGAYEASGFTIRHILDLAGVTPRRLVVTGGGSRDSDWVAAISDVTALPCDVVAVPEGAALGAAYLGRVAAGLEPAGQTAARWAQVGHRVEPQDRWVPAGAARYERYRELVDAANRKGS
ncbi:MAG TPA: FGGY-family carbohydrate kinase [Microthrixaceae bacterium]|nr:FGGY-family carbohydrate kinase [Microthrixaceae bacterium]